MTAAGETRVCCVRGGWLMTATPGSYSRPLLFAWLALPVVCPGVLPVDGLPWCRASVRVSRVRVRVRLVTSSAVRLITSAESGPWFALGEYRTPRVLSGRSPVFRALSARSCLKPKRPLLLVPLCASGTLGAAEVPWTRV